MKTKVFIVIFVLVMGTIATIGLHRGLTTATRCPSGPYTVCKGS